MIKLVLMFGLSFSLLYSQSDSDVVATIRLIEGHAGLLRKGSQKLRDAKVTMHLSVGDQIQSYEESLVELVFTNGEIVRLDELTTLTIEEARVSKARSSLPLGRVWVNMKKIVASREFDVATPTAVAAIRGTIYSMTAASDSSTVVSVYDGMVDVGPADALKQKITSEKEATKSSHQVSVIPGPTEISGPHEVTLEAWQTITAGLRIKVSSDGTYLNSKVPVGQDDSFILKNMNFDTQER